MDKITDRDAFLTWLKTNRATLQERTSDEVAHLARLVGFDAALVYQVLSHFEDALAGSQFDNRLTFHLTQEITAIETASGKTNLTEQWHALYWKLTEDRDFTEAY